MVTKILVRKEAGGKAAAVPSEAGAVDDKENRVNQQLPKEGDNDEKCAPKKERRDNIQPDSVGASDICHGQSKQDVSALSMPTATDGTIDEGKLAASASAMPPPNNDAKKKRSLAIENEDNNGQKKSRNKCIDLSDVPDQPLILKDSGKSGSSKYKGVSFIKAKNKWQVKLTIDGKERTIGCYDTEEEAAADYARAVFKYAPKKRKVKGIDLNDVPDQLPILKVGGKSGTSKYQGVSFNNGKNKWEAKLTFDGKQRHIGTYDTEEDAAADYARAVFKYAPKTKTQKQKRTDLTDVPAKPLILKGSGNSGTSKYQGVCLDKARNKWKAQIRIDGKHHYIGRYDTEEEAAVDYARAVFKCKEGESEVAHQKKQSPDLSEKPSVFPKGSKCGTSQLKGTFASRSSCIGDGVGPQVMVDDAVGSMMPEAAMRMHPAFRSGGMTSAHMTKGWSGLATAGAERRPSSMPFSSDGAPDGAPAGVVATATNGDSSNVDVINGSQEMPQLPESSENSSNTSGDTQRLLERNQFLEDSLMKAQAEIRFLKDMLLKAQAPAAGVLGSADDRSAIQN